MANATSTNDIAALPDLAQSLAGFFLAATAVKLWLALAAKGRSGRTAINELAADLLISTNTTRKAINELLTLGWLSSFEARQGHGSDWVIPRDLPVELAPAARLHFHNVIAKQNEALDRQRNKLLAKAARLEQAAAHDSAARAAG